MSKKGKGNIFTKGMQSDLDPIAQFKGTYRNANNIRLIGKSEDNIGVKPYDSDGLAFKMETPQLSP